jgi:hypothetical protein
MNGRIKTGHYGYETLPSVGAAVDGGTTLFLIALLDTQ